MTSQMVESANVKTFQYQFSTRFVERDASLKIFVEHRLPMTCLSITGKNFIF